MDRLRAAIIGSGGMAHTRANHLQGDERAEVVCVSSRNLVTGRSLAERYAVPYVEDWEGAIGRAAVDAGFVATPNGADGPIALAALEAGKHVLVEYPLAMTLREADALLDRAAAGGRILKVGHDHAGVGWHLGIKAAAA